MTDVQQKAAAKQFVKDWTGHGDEKRETQRHNNKREKESYKNPDIIPERAPDDVYFKLAPAARRLAKMSEAGLTRDWERTKMAL